MYNKILKAIGCLFFLILTSCSIARNVPEVPQETQQQVVTRSSINERTLCDDHLALLHSKYDAKGAAAVHIAGNCIGVLDYTFSASIANLRTFLSNADVSAVRIHIINNTCVRNRNCGKYEIGYGYTLASLNSAILKKDSKILNFLKERVALYKKFFQSEFPNTPVYISPILEHNLSKEAWRILADTTHDVWLVGLVNNPMGGVAGEVYREARLEDHGNKNLSKTSVFVSTDGVEIMDIDSVKYANDTASKKQTHRWSRRNNCRDQGPWKDPRARTSCLTAREAAQQVHVTDIVPKAPKPTFSCKFSAWNSSNIWKPLAEDKGTPDARKNLPVAIPSGMQHKNLDLVAINGKKVGSLGYYGKFSDGRPRMYSGYSGGSKKTGYEFEQEAVRLSGHRYVYAKQGNICKGPLLPGRRQGDFR